MLQCCWSILVVEVVTICREEEQERSVFMHLLRILQGGEELLNTAWLCSRTLGGLGHSRFGANTNDSDISI